MGEMIEFAANGGKAKGYLARPDQPTRLGIIVLQEWWGLNDHIKNVAERFAKEGFVVLAPDLYQGEVTKKPDEAERLLMALNIQETEKLLRGSVDELLHHIEGKKVGIMGFCMGGQLALFAACQNEKIGGCVDFYGIHPKVQPDLKNLQCPLYGFFGEKDASVKPAAAKGLKQKLVEHKKSVMIEIYPEAGHAFFNDTREEAYHEDAANDAWEKMLLFFRDVLTQ